MEFRIAKTFEESLSRLANEEQKAAKITVTDLQLDPSAPGLSFHKLDRAQDPNFASVRISRDLRLIVHQLHGNLLICYVGHHDNAYQWAERRKLEVHPTTGAAQIVEVREVVQDVIIPNYIVEDRPNRVSSPKLQMMSCSATASHPNGWMMSATQPRIRFST